VAESTKRKSVYLHKKDKRQYVLKPKKSPKSSIEQQKADYT